MCELDSHADTCCLGKDCLVLYETDKAEVSGFSTQLGKIKETPVITGVLAYDEPETGETYLLYFHQALHLPMMEKSLLNPNQMREAGIIVNDVPLKFIKQEQRTSEPHSLVVPINDDNGNTLTIPLELKGVISGFTVRKPSWEEIANIDPANRIEMTNDNPEWAPNDSTEEDVDERRLRQDVRQDMVRTKGSRSLSNRMTKMVRVNSRTVAETSHKRKGTIDPIGLASRWGIGLSVAERTFKATTQLGVRDFSQGVGSKRLKHTAYQLKHRRLRADVYTDTLFSDTKSLSQNTCGQIFATEFGWVQFYPLERKKDAHTALEKVFNDYGIFNSVVPDNAPELTSGKFKKTAQKFGCRIKPIEAWTPNQNLAEANIRELKRAYRREMRRTNAPAVLWDHCLQLVAERRSHTVSATEPFDEGPPIKMLTGDTPDISHLVEHRWYDPVWYSNPGFENRELGRWLGPSKSVGQAMSSKILTRKGKIVHRTSVWPLSVEKSHDPSFTAQREQFDTDLKEDDDAYSVESDSEAQEKLFAEAKTISVLNDKIKKLQAPPPSAPKRSDSLLEDSDAADGDDEFILADGTIGTDPAKGNSPSPFRAGAYRHEFYFTQDFHTLEDKSLDFIFSELAKTEPIDWCDSFFQPFHVTLTRDPSLWSEVCSSFNRLTSADDLHVWLTSKTKNHPFALLGLSRNGNPLLFHNLCCPADCGSFFDPQIPFYGLNRISFESIPFQLDTDDIPLLLSDHVFSQVPTFAEILEHCVVEVDDFSPSSSVPHLTFDSSKFKNLSVASASSSSLKKDREFVCSSLCLVPPCLSGLMLHNTDASNHNVNIPFEDLASGLYKVALHHWWTASLDSSMETKQKGMPTDYPLLMIQEPIIHFLWVVLHRRDNPKLQIVFPSIPKDPLKAKSTLLSHRSRLFPNPPPRPTRLHHHLDALPCVVPRPTAFVSSHNRRLIVRFPNMDLPRPILIPRIVVVCECSMTKATFISSHQKCSCFRSASKRCPRRKMATKMTSLPQSQRACFETCL